MMNFFGAALLCAILGMSGTVQMMAQEEQEQMAVLAMGPTRPRS